MSDCLFCKIIAGEIPSHKIYEDEYCFAFHDISPQAPVHFLVVPKTHISGANKVNAGNESIVGHIFTIITKLADGLDCGEDYRVVTNCGAMAGQTVEHLHFHCLAKRSLAWPPG